MEYEIYDFYMKSGNVIRAAQVVSDGRLNIKTDGANIVDLLYSFRALPEHGIGCPNAFSVSQIECIVYIDTIKV